MKKALLIYANGSEDIEITTPADVLNRAGVEVVKAAIAPSGQKTVTLAHKTTVICDLNLDDVKESFDLIVVPGGLPGAQYCAENNKLISLLQEQLQHKRLIAAICAAPGMVLAAHQILTTQQATGYPGTEQNIQNYTGQGVTVSDNFITAKGPAFALDFSLTLVEKLLDKQVADRIAQGMLKI